MNFKAEYEAIKQTTMDARREIHRPPELEFEEIQPAETICSVLDKFGISYVRGIAKTGIVATIGKEYDKVLLIRADMDALPIEERTSLEFASENYGVMHACGHDIHIASALAAAVILKNNEHLLHGAVKVVFQPAEEGDGGATPMINEGILENPKVTCAIGGHVTAEYDVGVIRTKPGALMASPDDFSIKFIGKSTHGAEPQNGISPILPACEMVSKASEIQAKLCENYPDVLSVCSVIANGGINIIPDEALILGTFRSVSSENRKNAQVLLKEYAQKIADDYSCRLEFNYNEMFAPLINDEATTKVLCDIARAVVGEENVFIMQKHLMTGEDFSAFGEFVPSVFFWYGGKKDTATPLHSSDFVANEDAIEVCAHIFCEFANNYLR